MASKALPETWRGYLIDHHMPDRSCVDLSQVDYAAIEENLQKANIDHLLLYFKDHWGYCYYPSEKGPVHPSLTADFDGTVADICRRNNIAVNAYYCAGFDEYVYTHHPEWALVDEDGQHVKIVDPNRPGQYFPPKWHWLCVNNAYVDYQVEHIREIVSRYKPDGFFLDIFGIPLCYCPSCRESFRSHFNMDIPTGSDKEQYRWEIETFRQEIVAKPALEKIVGTVKDVDPTIPCTLNGGVLHHPKSVLDLVDYVFAEPIVGSNTFVSSLFARGTNSKPLPTQIGPGTVSDAYDPRPREAYLGEMLKIISHGVRPFLFSGPLGTTGRIQEAEFESVGYAFSEIRKIQALYVNRKPLAQTAILFSPQTLALLGEAHAEKLAGALDLATYTNWPVAVVSADDLADGALVDTRLLLVPNAECMTRETAEQLTAYVETGGVLVVDGAVSMHDKKGNRLENFALADVMGCTYGRINRDYARNYWGSFIPSNAAGLFEDMPAGDLGILPPFVEVTPDDPGDVRSCHVFPAVAQSDNDWINWWSPPPGEATPHPALIQHKHGKGQTLYFTFDFFGLTRAGFNWVYPFTLNLFRTFTTTPSVTIELPNRSSVGTTYLEGDGDLLVTQIDLDLRHRRGEPMDIPGGVLTIARERLPAGMCEQVYPEKRQLSMEEAPGGYRIDLPSFRMAQVFRLS